MTDTALFVGCKRCDPGAAETIARALSEYGLRVVRAEPEDDFAAHDPRLLVGHGRSGAAVLRAATSLPRVRAVATIGVPADGLTDALPTLGRPLLVMHAPTDQVVGIDHARRIFVAAKHPKSYLSLDDADHALSRPADAEYAATVLAAWAERFVAAPLRRERPAAVEGHVVVRETGFGKYRNAIVCGPHTLIGDEPTHMGGDETGPTPYDLLLAGLGACTSMTLRMYADHKGWPLERATVTLHHEKIHAADCAACETETGKVDRIERTVKIEGDLDADQRARLLQIANKCPVPRTLHSEVVVHTTEAGT